MKWIYPKLIILILGINVFWYCYTWDKDFNYIWMILIDVFTCHFTDELIKWKYEKMKIVHIMALVLKVIESIFFICAISWIICCAIAGIALCFYMIIYIDNMEKCEDKIDDLDDYDKK